MPPAQKAEWLLRAATARCPRWQSGRSGSDRKKEKLFQCRRQIMLLLCKPAEHGGHVWHLLLSNQLVGEKKRWKLWLFIRVKTSRRTSNTAQASVDINPVDCWAETAIRNRILCTAVEVNRKPEWFCHRRLLSLRPAATGSLCLTETEEERLNRPKAH